MILAMLFWQNIASPVSSRICGYWASIAPRLASSADTSFCLSPTGACQTTSRRSLMKTLQNVLPGAPQGLAVARCVRLASKHGSQPEAPKIFLIAILFIVYIDYTNFRVNFHLKSSLL
jgi:hypothetical protein